MGNRFITILRRLLCLRHDYRPSSSWPDVIVCRRCGFRKVGAVSNRSSEALK